MASSTTSSRPATASTTSSYSRRSTDLASSTQSAMITTPGKSKFDIWNLIKRPATANAYHLTSRYRMSNGPIRRAKTGMVHRKRRKDSHTNSISGESNRSTTATSLYDFEKDFLDEYDFDAEDERDMKSPESGESASHSQGVYLRACRRMKVSPNSYVFRNLIEDHLQLKHHLLGPEGVKAIAVALIENSSVTSLDLEDNGLGVQGVEHIGEVFVENTFIQDLNLAQNELRTDGTKLILQKLKETDIVQKLNLSGNNLQEYDGELFQPYIEETHNLRELRLNHNCFRELGGIALGDCLSWNETLERVELSWNHLRSNGAKAIARALACNASIKYMDVSWNGFYLDGCKEMAQALMKNTTLEFLDMRSNRINKQCLEQLAKGLRVNSTLKILRLGDNPMTSTGAFFLLKQMLEIPSSGLQEIDLGHQSVEPAFLELLEKIKEVRPSLKVTFGAVLGQDCTSRDDEQELMDENPVVVLMEFGNILGYRLVDLFAMMDKDNSKTLTREEIKMGLLGCNIPLSEKALDVLVQKLDEDGDGEIDYGELIAGRKAHRRKINRAILASRDRNEDPEETEVGRVRMKLKRLMDKRQEELRPKSGVTILNSKTTVAGDTQQKQSQEQTNQQSGPGNSADAAVNGVSLKLKSLLGEMANEDSTDGKKEENSGGSSGNGEEGGINPLFSSMPRPTEEGAGDQIVLPQLKKGSLFKELMS